MYSEEMVSVIVPVYNAEKYIKRCVDSIRGQTISELEILLIDDGSVDLSGSLCDIFSQEDDRITVRHTANQGVSAARNMGLNICHGKYVTFVDADDYLEPDFLEILLVLLYRDKTSVAVCANDAMDDAIEAQECVLDVKKDFTYKKCVFGFQVWGKVYRREILEQLRFQEDINIGEDMLFFGEVMLCISQISYTGRKLYHYMNHMGSAIREKFSERRYTEISAWKKLCMLYQNDAERYKECVIGYISKCYHMYIMMRMAKIKNDNRYGTLVKEVRRYYKYIRKDVHGSEKMCIGLFVLMPRTFSIIYRVFHGNRMVYENRNCNNY